MDKAIRTAFLLAVMAVTVSGMSRKPAEPLAAESRAGAVTVRELDLAVDRYLKQLRRISPDRAFTDAEVREIRATTINDLVLRRIFMAIAKKKGVTVLDSDVRERWLIVCTGLFENSEEAFKKALVEDGWTEDEYLVNLREIITAEKVRTGLMDDINVAPAEAESYYRAHLADYSAEEMALRHILVAAPERDAPERGLTTVRTQLLEQKVPAESLDARAAAELRRREEKAASFIDSIKQGADFAALAQHYSDDGSAAQGGDLGRVAQGQMVKPFDEAAFALKKGQISGVVRTEFGFHLIRAESDPAVRQQPFDEVEYAIQAKLRAVREADRIVALEKEWKVRRYN
ncbi:MAG: peptidylprolyl isomerase [Fibrobacterota bacterium]